MVKPHYDFVLDLVVDGIHPPISRRLKVPGRLRLSQLHQAIQTLFGWTDSHLHDFTVKGHAYGNLEHFEEDWDGLYEDYQDEADVRLEDLLGDRGKFDYRYDFGDSWRVTIQVRSRQPADAGTVVECQEGHRAGPPDDCGGTPGHAHLLRALADPSHA